MLTQQLTEEREKKANMEDFAELKAIEQERLQVLKKLEVNTEKNTS